MLKTEIQYTELMNLQNKLKKQQKRGTNTTDENFHAPKKDFNPCPQTSVYQNLKRK